MEALGCLAAVIGIPILIGIFRALFGGNKTTTIQRELEKGLIIKCVEDTITTESGERVEVYKLSMSGTCAVPSENYPCKIVVIDFFLIQDHRELKAQRQCLPPTEPAKELTLFPSSFLLYIDNSTSADSVCQAFQENYANCCKLSLLPLKYRP